MSLLCEGIRGLWGSHRRRWAAISLLAVGATLGVAGSSTGATRASQLDPSFGTGGIVQTDFSSNADVARGLVEQRDGKLVTAGVATQVVGTVTNQDFGLARYNPDGTLDSTFGSGGKVSTDFTADSLDEAFPVVLQPDGKIIAAGRSNANFALARYTPDGSLDPSFGAGGKVTTDLGSSEVIRAMLLQPDGKIVVDGASGNDVALARYNPDGSLDAGFGSGGVVKTDFNGGVDIARGISLQSDGKIVEVGRTQVGSFVGFTVARYNPEGSLDQSFGSGGKVITNLNGGAFGVVSQDDGRLVVAGATGQTAFDFALVRYNEDGSLDPSFGVGGSVFTDFGTNADEAFALTLDGEGRIIAAGHAGFDFALARYNDAGHLTRNFGVGGKLVTDITSGDDEIRAVAVQPDGSIVTAGRNGGPDFTLARYLGDA